MVENLLASSSDIHKLLFTAKEWDHQDNTIVAHEPPLSIGAVAKVKSIRFMEDSSMQDPLKKAWCPKLLMIIKGREVRVLINTSAEINLISFEMVRTLWLLVIVLNNYKW